MYARTTEQINTEIETVRATTEVTLTKLNQEKMLVEALNACKNDEELRAVENIGPSFIDQYFSELEKFTDCSCTGNSGFGDLLYVILPSIGLLIEKWEITEGDKIIELLMGKRISGGNCYRRHELIRLYCLVKNDPFILDRVREEETGVTMCIFRA